MNNKLGNYLLIEKWKLFGLPRHSCFFPVGHLYRFTSGWEMCMFGCSFCFRMWMHRCFAFSLCKRLLDKQSSLMLTYHCRPPDWLVSAMQASFPWTCAYILAYNIVSRKALAIISSLRLSNGASSHLLLSSFSHRLRKQDLQVFLTCRLLTYALCFIFLWWIQQEYIFSIFMLLLSLFGSTV